jgi:RimJ/RimL family protein N-acetyltransferase
MPLDYPPLNVVVRTPRLELCGATDELLALLAPTVRDGIVAPDEAPFDDPMSLYADSPEREWRWLRGIWAGRAHVDPQSWRLYFVVMVDGAAAGMQDVIGTNFASFGRVGTFSWLAPSYRGRGLGTEMRAAAIELAFAGLDAREAFSEAFVDNAASNRVSRALGYESNGTEWATRRGEPALMFRWRLTREVWEGRRRDDITLIGAEACRPLLGLP